MTLTRRLTLLAFVTALSLVALPAQAQHRGGGGSRGGSHRGTVTRGVAVVRSVPVYSQRNTYYRPYFYRSYYRPYYSFVPRIRLGFGLTIGYPVAYPYYYGYPAYGYGYGYGYGYPSSYGYRYPPDPYGYGYAPPPAYNYPPANQSSGYPQQNYPSAGYSSDNSSGSGYQTQPRAGSSVNARPGTSSSAPGGVSLEVTPSTASVFVDGTYMGTGDEFGSSAPPLGLTPGRHHIEVRANGYQTMSFDATVTAGQVLPYQASLQRKQ